MKDRTYLIYGILLCLGMAYANAIGWDVFNFKTMSMIGPRGPNIYHK